MVSLYALKLISEVEFATIVKTAFYIGYKLRIILKDNSFVDVNLSQKLSGRFGYHWESMDKNRTIFRYDNFPDIHWHSINTFPYHFHNGSQDQVEPSPFPKDILEGFRAFMKFIQDKIRDSDINESIE